MSARRDRGTPVGRLVGWVLSYPVRFLLIVLAIVLLMTMYGL